jgi:hypothetical protein
MDDNALWRAISAYEPEISNIRYFLREKRTISEWQDWLWKRMPRLTAKTVKIRPSMVVLGGGWDDLAPRYTDLLTSLCKLGSVERVRYAHTTTYKWVGA